MQAVSHPSLSSFPVPNIFNKDVLAIHIIPKETTLTFLMRKVYNILLKFAGEHWSALPQRDRDEVLQRIEANREAKIGAAKIVGYEFTQSANAILKELGYNANNAGALKKTLRDLLVCKVEWNVMGDKDFPESETITTLLADLTFHRGGNITWSYSNKLFSRLVQPQIWGTIDIAVQNELSSYAALALYENVIRYADVAGTGWKKLEKWKELLSSSGTVTPETFSHWRTRVLDRAREELKVASGSRVIVDWETRTGAHGRVTELRFSVKRVAQKALPTPMPIPPDYSRSLEFLTRWGFSEPEIIKLTHKYDANEVWQAVEYVRAQMQGKGKNGEAKHVPNPKGYLKRALENGWAATAALPPTDQQRREQREAAQREKVLKQEFKAFQLSSIKDAYAGLPFDDRLAYYQAFRAADLVKTDGAHALLRQKGMDALQDTSIDGRSVAGLFFPWLLKHSPSLLGAPEARDFAAFKAARAAESRPEVVA